MLNEYASEVCRHLLAAFPEWEPLFGEDPDDDGVLLVRVPSPADPALTLNVFTDDDELTIAFDMWHSHIGWPCETASEDVAAGLAIINDLMAERMVVAVKLADGKWAESAALAPDEMAANPGEWSYVRSWQGSYNRGDKSA
jgi:hypothetical protein